MKALKIKVTLLLLVSAMNVATAQQSYQFGFEAGPSYTSLRGNQILSQFHKGRLSYSAGTFFRYDLSEHVYFKSGVYLENKGSLHRLTFMSLTGETTPSTIKFHLDYVTVPLMAGISFGERLKWHFNGGGFTSFLVASRTDQSGTAFVNVFPSEFSAMDAGVLAGAGVSYPLGQFRVSAELRSNMGLMNVSAVPVFDNGNIKTSFTSLMLGVAYAPNRNDRSCRLPAAE